MRTSIIGFCFGAVNSTFSLAFCSLIESLVWHHPEKQTIEHIWMEEKRNQTKPNEKNMLKHTRTKRWFSYCRFIHFVRSEFASFRISYPDSFCSQETKKKTVSIICDFPLVMIWFCFELTRFTQSVALFYRLFLLNLQWQNRLAVLCTQWNHLSQSNEWLEQHFKRCFMDDVLDINYGYLTIDFRWLIDMLAGNATIHDNADLKCNSSPKNGQFNGKRHTSHISSFWSVKCLVPLLASNEMFYIFSEQLTTSN